VVTGPDLAGRIRRRLYLEGRTPPKQAMTMPVLVRLGEPAGNVVVLDADAVARIATDEVLAGLDPQRCHVIDLRPGGWTMQHPLTCRLSGDLFSCPYNQAAEGLGPMDRLGRYVCHLADGRVMIGDPV
jgi:hypothetical protein